MYYQLNLHQLVKGLLLGDVVDGWTPGLLLSLAYRLPEGAETNAELMGSRDYRDWSLSNHLSIALINATMANTNATLAAGGIKPKKFQPIKPPDKNTVRPLDWTPKPRRKPKKNAWIEAVIGHFGAGGAK